MTPPCGTRAEALLSPIWGMMGIPQEGDTMNIGEQRRTIYIEPIEELPPEAEPASLPEEPRPIGTSDPAPAR
jgi:hypothetical protein